MASITGSKIGTDLRIQSVRSRLAYLVRYGAETVEVSLGSFDGAVSYATYLLRTPPPRIEPVGPSPSVSRPDIAAT